MILVLTHVGDEHADHVVDRLVSRGARVVRFDPGDFPARAEIATRSTRAGFRTRLRTSDLDVDLADVAAAWYRRPSPARHEGGDPALAEMLGEQTRGYLHDVWSLLRCAWLPGSPATLRLAEHKLLQLQVAGELGFVLPATLVGNSPDDFLAFHREQDGRLISKLASSRYGSLAHAWMRYTEVVSHRAVAHAGALRRAPVIVQAYVAKRLELRVTVVGERVFAAEIHSQAGQHARHDWRHYDAKHTPHQVHELPDEIVRRCVALTRKLGLHFGAIDLILTPDGHYVFVEINPNGQFLWIEQRTGLPISDAIADLLIARGGVS